MTDEEMRRAMEFIVQQQSQYAARFDRDESRLLRLEESFKILVELARGMDERLETTGQTIGMLSHTMDELVRRTIILGEAQSQTDARLTEAQIRLDTKMEELAEAQRQTDGSLRQTDARLTESQIRLDTKMAELADSHLRLDAIMAGVAEAQARTDVRLNSLIDIVVRNDRNVN